MSRFALCSLVCSCSSVASVAGGEPVPTPAPRELGRVHWRRGYDAAADDARKRGMLLLVVFQEIPGCSTCVNYGRDVLSHPLLVEAMETQFVPVAVHNNARGDDERVLKSFDEPSWNNPVVRILSPDRKTVSIRVTEDYSIAGLAAAMVRALEQSRREVPAYLRLVAEEAAARRRGVETATFAMHCFWEGEGALGALPGVVSTMPGFVDGMEVVEVEFDPARLSFEKLAGRAKASGCASRVFARNAAQLAQARTLVGSSAVRSDEPLRPDKEPKYYLLHSDYRFIPMTATQASRVNSALGRKAGPDEFLSPRQLELLKAVRANAHASWPLAAGAPDLRAAWDRAEAILRKTPRVP